MRQRKTIEGLTISLGSILVFLVIAELALRLVYPITYMKPPTELPDDVWREILHRESDIPGLAYELAPDREKFAHGAIVRTNSLGMRDDEPPLENGEIRHIVAIGDSITFGFGVEGDESYPNILERLLKEGIEDDQFVVLNLGVGGYSSQDEALALEHKGMRWNPELIIIGYALNDPEIDPRQPLHKYFQKAHWWQNFHIFRLAALAKNRFDQWKFGQGDYFIYLYEHPTKWQSVVEAFKNIGNLTDAENIPVLVVIFPRTGDPWPEYLYREVHDKVALAAEESGFHVLDLLPIYSIYSPMKLAQSASDPHPTVFGHELAATAIYDWILNSSNVLTGGLRNELESASPDTGR